MKRLVFDLDNTLTINSDRPYHESLPRQDIIKKLREYKAAGFEIIISTSRNVRTYKSNIGKINANTLPVIIKWLETHNIPYDEIYVGKPWCGEEGFYIDDKAIRPSELNALSYKGIKELLDREK
jgi:capsule biosynthesis phosphatase